MSRRWFLLVIILLITLPTALSARWIKDKVAIETEAVGDVVFSHYDHMAKESVGKNCPTCHNDVYHIVTKKNPAFTMAEMEAGKACGVCHNGKQAFNVTGDCTTCHAGDLVITYGDGGKATFSHEVHAGMFGCDECHPDLFAAKLNSTQVGMQAMEQGESCGACHDGDTAFSVKSDCGSCHISVANLTIKSTVGGIFFSHEIHTGMFGCDECHPDIFKAKANSNQVGMKAMEQGESCGTCHDDSTAFGVKSDCAICHTGAVELDIATQGFGPVPFSHEIHTGMFGCSECHPDIFTAKTNSNQIGMKAMEKGDSCGACHDGDTAFGVKGDCATCHVGAVQISIKTDHFGPVPFSHELHSDMFSCSKCHPKTFQAKANANQAGMKAMEQGKSCGACHNNKDAFGVKDDCATCHTGAAELKIATDGVGLVPFSHELHTGMFGCSECHPDIFKARLNANQVGMQAMENGDSCGACHDGGTAFGVKDDCATCHSGAGEIAIKTEDVGTIAFSHELHTSMFSCLDCHPTIFKAQAGANQVGMQAMEKGQSCGACHDGDNAFGVKGDCATCHAGDIEYKEEDAGNVIFPHSAHSDMFSCDECHPDLFKASRGTNGATMEEMENGASCGACHDGSSAFGVAEDCEACHAM